MGKIQCQLNESAKSKQAQIAKKKKSGRPINRDIETLFINIIRDIKLQAINAQVELQLEIAFFTNDEAKKYKKKSESSVSDKWLQIYEFSGLTSVQKKKLHEFFDICQKKWSFKQIQQESDLQQLFFDDESDLAFILHNLIEKRKQAHQINVRSEERMRKRINQCHEVKAQELFYLSLLSLNSRQHLRDVVLDFLLRNQTLIVNILWTSMQKARIKYSQNFVKNKEDLMQNEGSLSGQIGKQVDGPVEESICDNSQMSRASSKKKIIKKPLRKQNRAFQFQGQDLSEALTQKEKQEKLILCFVNYISWSYLYVLREEQEDPQNIEKSEEANKVSTQKQS